MREKGSAARERVWGPAREGDSSLLYSDPKETQQVCSDDFYAALDIFSAPFLSPATPAGTVLHRCKLNVLSWAVSPAPGLR